MKNLIKNFFIVTLSTFAFSQTTGKISGIIKDADSNEPLIAANVMVQGTAFGAATDLDGSYYIINIKPGTYTVVVDMIGYKQMLLENVRVSVNRTTTIDAALTPTVIQGETVIVEVDAITTKKDQTSTIKNISSDQKTTDITFTVKREDLTKTLEILKTFYLTIIL